MIPENLDIVEAKIDQACVRSGRKRSEITLVAVSKTYSISVIENAISAGLKHFGENKAQEFSQKTLAIESPIFWHFIGHLQTNKVKYIIDKAELIHSVDSIKLAAEIQKRAAKINKVQNILIEVNTSGEESKFGLSDYSEVSEIADYCRGAENLNLKGLMTMAPYTDDEFVIRNSFGTLRKLKDELNANDFNLTELSMGMSNDFELAIEEGATIVRVGTALFGERYYEN